uniref:Uncharacterized protein n=1 Tax=Leersia perrieri TaxID=77586 RepID=A0A0D9XGR2_9ORYZ
MNWLLKLDLSDEKYCCSETGYRLPLKCVQVQNGTKEGYNNKQWKVLDDASTSRSCKALHNLQELLTRDQTSQSELLTTLASCNLKELAEAAEDPRMNAGHQGPNLAEIQTDRARTRDGSMDAYLVELEGDDAAEAGRVREGRRGLAVDVRARSGLSGAGGVAASTLLVLQTL